MKGSLALGPYGQAPLSHGPPPPPETLGLRRFGPVADQEGLGSQCIQDEVQGSLWNDALQRNDSDAAIERFWRCACIEIWPFLWSVGVPGGSRRRPRDRWVPFHTVIL